MLSFSEIIAFQGSLTLALSHFNNEFSMFAKKDFNDAYGRPGAKLKENYSAAQS
ncbi:MAG: hypothetical protein LBM19_01685 [Holosporales bacterium]|jgi:hypothetical protein|nr:hypothetical protein [Holosporales bacterium]